MKRYPRLSLLLGLCLLLASCDSGGSKPPVLPDLPPVSTPSQTEQTPPVSAESETTTRPAALSSFETAPVSPPETGRLMSAEGELKASPVKNLELRALCKVAHREGANTAKVTVSLYIDHYSMSVGERAGCYLSVNGEKVKFTSPKIDMTEDTKSSTFLFEHTFDLQKEKGDETFKMELEAAYLFNGVYSSTKITDITIRETVMLKSE